MWGVTAPASYLGVISTQPGGQKISSERELLGLTTFTAVLGQRRTEQQWLVGSGSLFGARGEREMERTMFALQTVM